MGITLLAGLTLPLWLGGVLAQAGPRFGLTFSDYERLSYTRFALRDVAYRSATLKADVDRVELTSPFVWLWQRGTGQRPELVGGKWVVTITPAETNAANPAPDPESGWMTTRQTVRDAVAQVDSWISRAQLESGRLILPSAEITVAGVTWAERELVLRDVVYQNFNVDVNLAVPTNVDELRLTTHVNQGEGTLTLVSRGATVDVQATWWEQPATLSARFAPRGWLPDEAAVTAADWRLPGSRLKLQDYYRQVEGTLQLTWRDQRFTTNVAARGTAQAEAKAPPLDVTLRAHGDLASVTVEAFRTQLPGINAELNVPFTVNRAGRIDGDPARIGLDVDLAQQPWFKATGTVHGQLQLTSGAQRIPQLEFQIDAKEVVAEGVAIASAEARGGFVSPMVQLESATLAGADGTRVTLKGGYNTQTQELSESRVQGEMSRTTLARWLPAQPQFETIKLDATASGKLPDVQHRGSSEISAVSTSGLKPLEVALTWNGAGRVIEEFAALVSAEDSKLSVGGSVSADAVRLARLEFAPNGASALSLRAPATFQWTPTLRLDSLRLEGPNALLQAAATWGSTGQVDIAVRGVQSSWLADFVTLPERGWEVSSVALTSTWKEGPMTFAAVAGATSALDEQHRAVVHVDVRGDGDGIRVNALRAEVNQETVVNAHGFVPAVITPGGAQLWKMARDGRVALSAATAAQPAFWQEISKLSGVKLTDPRVLAHVAGTWAKPTGELEVNAGRIEFLAKEGATAPPPVDDLSIRMSGDVDALVLNRCAFKVAGQIFSADGRVPVPARGWEALREKPLEFLREKADLRIRIPDADLAEFAQVLPEAVLPQGRVQVDVVLHQGGIDGTLKVADAATRPLGPAGALRDIQVDVELKGQTVTIRSVSAETGGERVNLTGRIGLPELDTLRGEKADLITKLSYDLAVKGTNLPFVRKTGLLVRGDVDVKLTSPSTGTPQLTGTVRLRDSLFLQDVRSLLPGDTRSKSSRRPYFAVEVEPFAAWRLDISVVGTEFMRLRATGFAGVASARFQLSGTLGEPLLLGDATIDRGQVKFPFATFNVDNGRVSLTRANPFEPQIDLLATTRRYEFDLRMEVTGNASSPEVKFESAPPLEHGQVLQMVLAGIVPNTDVNVTQQQRVTRLGAYLGQNLLSSFIGDGDDSNRLSITTGEDISEQGRETYRFDYNLNERWALTGEYDQYDTQTVGVKWQALARGGKKASTSSADTNGEGADESEAADPALPPAKLEVKGLGLIGDRELEASLRRLLGEERRVMDANAIEDALFLLMSAVKEKGYLQPQIELSVTTRAGEKLDLTIGSDLATPLPRSLSASQVTFAVKPGVRSLVEEVKFSGLEVMKTDRARDFFVGDKGLFRRRASRIYTPSRLSRSVQSLESELRSRGYAEATVNAEQLQVDEATGAARVQVQVNEGPRWHVSGVNVEGADKVNVALPELSSRIGVPWTESVEQDVSAEVRNAFLAAGYPDVRVRVSHTDPAPGTNPDERNVDVTVRVDPGAQITLGEIRYIGRVKILESVLDRRVENQPGQPLNLLELERARYRISRLGVFERVDLELSPAEGPVRDAVFTVEPGPDLEVNLLAGYNSYEQLRAGVEVRQFNLWGRAHQTRGLLVQSLKSSRGEYTYTVPELFGENVNGTARLFGLQREEVAFLRQEYGVKLSVDTPLRFLGANATAGYTFEVLRNDDNELETSGADATQVEVASVDGGLTRERLDNPLLPRDGYRIYGRAEAASRFLGGRAEYQRFEFGGSYHRPWGEGRWWHFAAAHGLLTTFGVGGDERLPVNRRFFPGGDGSIRGYNNGEAAPRGADGRFVGAKTYTNASVEFEQMLVQNLSGVVFFDALGMAAKLADYPYQQTLFAVGLGVRYQTVVGPIRAEYGHNLKRRRGDPAGTFHFSIGFPF